MDILHGKKREKCTNYMLRASHRIPGVIYGLNRENFNAEFSELELYAALKRSGEHGIINVDEEGRVEKAIIKEVQHDPVTHRPIHIDLQRVDDASKLHAMVGIVLGSREGLRSGNIIQSQISQVEVECKPEDLPSYLYVDLSGAKAGDRVTLSDITAPKGVVLLGNAEAVIATVTRASSNHFSEEESQGLKAEAK